MPFLKRNQKIIFQYEYINYAWEYQHAGWFIDSSGNIYCYNLPDNWNHYNKSEYFSYANMNSNILKTDSVCFNLDKNELADKIELIKEAANGEISEPVQEMWDAGIYTFVGFIYYPKNNIYKKIILKQLGDIKIENKSQAAIELYNWLDSINNKVRNLK